MIILFKLREYTTSVDRMLQVAGSLLCFIAGATLPFMTVVLGSSIKLFAQSNQEHLQQEVNKRVIQLVAIGIGAAVTTYLYSLCWILSGQRIASRLRESYLRGLLEQPTSYLDKIGPGEVTTRLVSHVDIIQSAISLNTSQFLTALSTFVAAFLIALVRCWKLTLIISFVVPAIFIPTGFLALQVGKNAKLQLDYSASAQTQAAETLSAIRAVKSLKAQRVFAENYDRLLSFSEKCGTIKSLWQGGIHGNIYFVIYVGYALAFWQGSKFLITDGIDIGIIINVLFAVVIGTLAMGRLARMFEPFSTANSLFSEISNLPGNSQAVQGSLPLLVDGAIDFEHVTFTYPAASDRRALDDITIHVPAGKCTALVGPSGSGKSTLSMLLQRFYSTSSGQIMIDGHPLSELDISTLRSQMAVVSQEPMLFSGSIGENIQMGLSGTPFEKDEQSVQMSMVREAAAKAGISCFIESLPDSYDTAVGDVGSRLSGGQKQRIAFARAIIRNPRILILDETTSALDAFSEAAILDFLDQYSCRTTIVIAHRLSTIRAADNIVVLDQGRVIEQGSHSQLVRQNGLYASLLEAQFMEEKTNRATLSFQSRELSFSHGESQQKGASRKGQTEMLVDGPTARGSNRQLYRYILRILRLNSPEWHLMAMGILAAIVCGSVYPIQGYLFAKLINLSTNTRYSGFKTESETFSFAFLAIAGVNGAAHFLTTYLLSTCAERMLRRAKRTTLANFLEQPLSYFLNEEHSTSMLTFHLTETCSKLTGLHGSALANLLETAVNLFSGILFSLVISWKFSSVVAILIPFILLAGYWRFRLLRDHEQTMKQWQYRCTQIACEAIASIHTIAALVREEKVLSSYRSALAAASRQAFVSTIKSSAIFALAHGMAHWVNAFAMWYGAHLIQKGQLGQFQYFAAFITLTLGAQDAGEVCSRVPDLGQAQWAAEWFFAQQKPDHKEQKNLNSKISIENKQIALENVSFSHVANPRTEVLSQISFDIHKGQLVAIVGPSGSGKSTLLDVIARFHSPTAGTITYDTPQEKRHLISYLPQEPDIFSGTVRFNLLLGTSSPSQISQAEMENACQRVGIREYIHSLPEGFDTLCNKKTMSVGQRQRLAIARTILQDAAVWLLDEPTAALDAYSSESVRVALRTAGRTVVIATHDPLLSQEADLVVVLEGGQVIESGTPAQLLSHGSYYSRLRYMSGNRVSIH